MMSYFGKNKNYILAGIVMVIAIVAIIFFILNSLKQGPVERPAEVDGNNFNGGATERASNEKEQDAGDDANDESEDNEHNEANMQKDIEVDYAGTRHNNLNGAPNTQMPLEQAETTLPAKNVAAPFPNTDTCETTNPRSESNAADIEVLQNPKQNEIKGSEITDRPEAETILDDDIVKKDQGTQLEKASPEVLASILNAQETYEYMVTSIEAKEAKIDEPSWVVPDVMYSYKKDLTSYLSEPDSFGINTLGL